ncbi:MAG: ABC transporter ATP-binding protein, partial [Pseudomonadota bacterium]
PAEITAIADAGRSRIAEARVAGTRVFVTLPEGQAAEPGPAHLALRPERTRLYADGWLVEGAP